ncbi:sulfite exporter TauE/SafE family protein [Azotobacter armeniacus]
MQFDMNVIFLFFFLAAVAGCVDAIAGGGGLIIIPSLLAIGVPPSAAIATNKVGAVGGSFSAALHFIRIKEINFSIAIPLMLLTFLGSLLGGYLLTRIDNSILEMVIPIFLIAFSLYFIFSKNFGKTDQKELISISAFGLTAAPIIGFYDGFFGPGTGTFLTISFIFLLGFNILKATAHAKVLNFSSNLAALSYFLYYGNIYWDIGLTMLAGQLLGGQIGAKLVVQNGQKLIKWVMVIVSVTISIKLLSQL